MYTVITHIIKEEHYDDLESALDAIANECYYSGSDSECESITITPEYGNDSYDSEYLYSVITPPGSDANIDYGNIKVRFPISG